MRTITEQSPYIHTLFNPIGLSIITTSEDDTIMTVEVIKGNDVSGTYKINAIKPFLNGKVHYDLSGKVKLFLSDTITELHDRVNIDERFFVLYTLNDPDVLGNMFTYVAINAVSRVGYPTDLTGEKGKFLTAFNKLKKYEGYPLDVAAINIDVSARIWINGELIYTVSSFNPHFLLSVGDDDLVLELTNSDTDPNLRTNDGDIITNNRLEPITCIDYPANYFKSILWISHECTPNNPFYVRWMSRNGGFDYWMFGGNQIISKSIDDTEEFEHYVEDTYSNYSTELVSATGIEKIKVGAQGLDPIDYAVVSEIVYSPLIEYYDKINDKWIRLLIDESPSEEQTADGTKSIELSFKFPTVNMQL